MPLAGPPPADVLPLVLVKIGINGVRDTELELGELAGVEVGLSG